VLTVMDVDLTKADVPAVTVFASQAAIALENARLYETAQQELAERKRAEEALRRSEERYRQLFEDSPISLWEEDFSAVKAHLDHLRDTGIRDFRDYFVDHPEAVVACAKMVEVLDVNKATLELYRVDSKEALRGELAKAFAPESYDAFREELIAIAEGKTAFERDAIVETLAGQTRHTLTRWSVAPGHENAFSRVLVSIIDITERKEAEDALRWRFTQLALINEIGSKLTAAPDLEQVLDLAARLVQEKFGYHHVAVFTVDRAREEIVMRARAGSYLSLFPLDYRLGTGEGMVGWVALHGERLLANNVAAEPRYINAYPALIPTRSELSVPIRVGGEVIGVLDAQSPHLAAFDENDVMVMETVADQIAVAIEDARLYEAIQRELTERRSEEKYRNIIESIPVGMHMYQLEPDGRLVFMDANPAADKILRVDNRQFVTRTVEEAFPALADSEIPATYRQVASDGQTRHWDDIYYKENQISGAFEVHAFQTSPGRMAAAFLDITERKQAEVRIRQQNEFLNSVLESLTHPFYVINANDYSVEVANSAARQGRSLEAATCYALSHQSDGPCRGREHPCPLEDVKRLKQPITVEHVHHDQDGNMRNVEVHCYPIVDDDGQVVQAIEYVLDITERKQAEQMLLQSERLAAMGRLAASVAHEINNPMQAVEGCLTLATEELADGRRLEKVERYLGIATGEIERIADIVRRVRAFYRPTVTGMQPTDVHAVLESVLALANKQLQHSHVIVERAWDDNLPTIEANPDHLKQVFLNLLLNAIDAMPDGGTLRLRTVPHTMPTSGQDPPPPAVYIEFSDTGQGMSLETQSRLFEPFFTTKEHGSGLGLYISHGIIESHKGQINVTSNEGLGSTVSILLPVEQP
jgi:signal transduction histidine kinase/GAF domain-containing protein